ncbi:MAG TPA: membrane dipeptidase [Steroidobacteraceae bacterium]|nr:membrane dipeptidase [Steroidobacteraceae bacterium]
MLTRREAIQALCAGFLCRWHSSAAASTAGYSDQQYARAMIIDALGGPGGFEPGVPDDAPLSPKFIADIRASGVTAVNVTVGEVGNGPNRFAKTVADIANMERELAAHPDVFLKVLRAKDLTEAKSTDRMGLIFGFQDTCMLDGDLTRLTTFYNLGVRVSQPTYNRRNLLGDGCLETADGGLSRLGHEFVAEMNRLHMLLDLSHAGPRTISDGIAASTVPAAITHTGCRALADLPRNTADSSLRALADRGGVAGIYFMPFLRVSGQPHAEDLIRHLEHAVNVCGEDHVGLGTDGTISGVELNQAYADYIRKSVEDRIKSGISAPGEAPDVFTVIPEYNGPRRFRVLADDLARRGWTSGSIDKVLGQNFARLFTEVWT